MIERHHGVVISLRMCMTLLAVLEMVWLAGCASPAWPSETYVLDARIAPR